MGSPRLGWDWEGDTIYEFRGTAPRVRLVTHSHFCPDGTTVTVTAQHVALTGATLYRWHVPGEDEVWTSSAVCGAEVPPDWTRVDVEHPMLVAA